MVDRLDRLRHDAVIGGDNQNNNIRDLGAAQAHLRKRGMARRIDEGNAYIIGNLHLIGANMLRDSAGLTRCNIGRTQGVEQRGLAVIDVAHHGYDRRARNLTAVLIRIAC